MLMWLAIILIASYIELGAAKCSNIPSGLYCTNLENNTDDRISVFSNDTVLGNKDVQVIYLRNSSGSIDKDTFSNFPKMKSLDIQFSSIDDFSPEIDTIETLYLMYNSKFPSLSADFMNECCQNLSILYIVGNSGLDIKTGAFKHLQKLTHLTVSKQNITNLTQGFFEGLENLKYLNLRQNGIQKIDGDTFKNLTDLNNLILSHNNFTELGPNTFQNLKELEALEIHGLNISNFNLSIFNKQVELKVLGLPIIPIKKGLELNDVIKTFPKLESLSFQNEHKEDAVVSEFINKCKANGYDIRFSNEFDL